MQTVDGLSNAPLPQVPKMAVLSPKLRVFKFQASCDIYGLAASNERDRHNADLTAVTAFV